MDAAAVERIESSFRLLAPRGPELVDRFYAQMFAAHPSLRAMFPADMAQQKAKLLASIQLVISNLRRPEALTKPLHELGARHASYGVMEAHYPVVRDTLVAVMAEMAGDAWTAQLAADWTAALDTVAAAMIEGQRAAATRSAASA